MDNFKNNYLVIFDGEIEMKNRNMILRFLIVVSTVIVLICFSPVLKNSEQNICFTVSALESSGQCGKNVFWSFDSSTGKLVISGSGSMYDYEYNTTPFRSNDVFDPDPYIKSVVVEEGVTKIGKNAFYDCSMSKLNIVGATKISESAFTGCWKLVEVKLPDELTYIGDKAFWGCSSLEEITIPDSVTVIREATFYSCYSLEKINIGKSVVKIEEMAFDECVSLKRLYLPKNVEEVETSFYKCGLKEIAVENDNCNFSLPYGVNIYGNFVVIYGNIGSSANYIADRYGHTFKDIKNFHKYKTKVISKTTTEKSGKVKMTCSECGNQITEVIPRIKTVTLSKTKYAYDKKEKKPSVVVKDIKGNKLKKDVDYEVKYSSGRVSVGTYKVKVTFIGKYSGTQTLTFKIVIGKVLNLKQNKDKPGLYVYWDKVTGATGYQIYEYKDGAWEKIKTIKDKETTYAYNKSVDFKVKWKIRAYYIDKNGKTHYGAFSDSKTFKGV